MRSVSVSSAAISVASVLASKSTSAAACAGNASASASQSALPVLVEVTSFHRGLLLREPPRLEILLARPQRVQQTLRLAAVHRLLIPTFRLSGLLLLVFVLLPRGLLLARGILLRLLLLLLAGRRLGRGRCLLLAIRVVFPRRGLLLLSLPRRLVLSGLSGGVSPLPVLGPQEQLEVHLGVDVVRVQRQRRAVLPDGCVRLARPLQGQRELIGGLWLQRGVAVLESALGFGGGGARRLGVDFQEGGGAVEGHAGVVGQTPAGLVVFAKAALRVPLRQQRVPTHDVVVLALDQAARRAGQRLLQPGEEARCLLLPGHQDHPLGGGERQRQQRRDHAGLRRKSGPSPSAAAAQSRTKAGQANQAYLSSYCTERRVSSSPFCILSSSGRKPSTPRSVPDAVSRSPLPRAVSSRKPATSVRVSTVRPSLSFL